MADGTQLSAGEFGVAFKGFLEQTVSQTPSATPFFVGRLTDHFGVTPTGLPIVGEQFASHEHPNLQLAFDDYVSEEGRSFQLLGVSSEYKRMIGIGLGDLAASPRRGGLAGPQPPDEGPVDYQNVESGRDEKVACVQFGLYLVKDADAPLAILVRGADTRGYAQASVNVEVMSAERADAERFLTEIRTRMRRRNVYRGRVVSLAVKPPMGALEVKFHRLPPVDRDGIVLPTDVLERIERQTIRFAAHRDRLLAAGRHQKR